jgi:uncharacterized protein YjiS (DUF1127 family)
MTALTAPTAQRNVPTGRDFLSRIAAAAAGLADGFRSRRRYARTVSELSQLDDRTLADIGLARSDIPSLSAAWAVGNVSQLARARAVNRSND